jgi:hypothetical protein
VKYYVIVVFVDPSTNHNGCIDDSYVIVCVYVDDLLITGPNVKQVEGIKQYLAETSQKIKDLKEVKKYLGRRIQRVDNQILLNQEDYIEEIINEYGKVKKIQDRKTPLPRDLSVLNDDEGQKVSPIYFMLGKIRYLIELVQK